MRTNPYRAPESDITPLPQTMPARPAAVTLTCAMFALNLLANFFGFMPQNELYWQTIPSHQVPGVVAALIVFVVVTSWLIFSVFRGNNWARWAKLELCALWVTILLTQANPDAHQTSQLIIFINTASTLIELPACALLFFGKGGKWFAACKNLAIPPF